jgi:hypothetical protein
MEANIIIIRHEPRQGVGDRVTISITLELIISFGHLALGWMAGRIYLKITSCGSAGYILGTYDSTIYYYTTGFQSWFDTYMYLI